jgi:hypothetical protein
VQDPIAYPKSAPMTKVHSCLIKASSCPSKYRGTLYYQIYLT